MANEIVALDTDGGVRYGVTGPGAALEVNLLFLFPIATPKQVNGTNVVPTPTATLSAVAALALTSTEKTQIDAGTMAWRTLSVKKETALTAGEMLTLIRGIYAKQLTEFTNWYTEKYRYVGQRFQP